jgi:hypothetical protein
MKTKPTLKVHSAGSIAALSMFFYAGHAAATDEAGLAMQLSNPIAALISVPFQYNWDTGIGTADADRSWLNIQPVIPV